MNKRVLHITAEREPLSYHTGTPKSVFGVYVAPEYYSDDDEAGARDYLSTVLGTMKSTVLHLYKVEMAGGVYTAHKVANGIDEVVADDGTTPDDTKFWEWIAAKNNSLETLQETPHRFATPLSQPETPDGSKASVGQILRTMQMLDAPVPHRLGLTRIVKFFNDIESDGEEPWHIILVTGKNVAPEPQYTVKRLDEGEQKDRFEVVYEPFDGIEVTAETQFLNELPDDLGLVDPMTGFLNAETTDPFLYRALRQFEETSATRLWVLPRLLEATEAVREFEFGSDAEKQEWARWLAIHGALTAFDPILYSLSPHNAENQPGDSRTEGPILSEIVGPVERLYETALDEYKKNNPTEQPLPRHVEFTDVLFRDVLIALLDDVIEGFNPGYGRCLKALLEALADPDDPDTLRPLIFALDHWVNNTTFEYSQADVTQALGALMGRLEDEQGAEIALNFFLAPLFEVTGTNYALVTEAVITELTDKGLTLSDAEKTLLAKVMSRLWRQVQTVLHGAFNGAEAARRATGEAWLKALLDDVRNVNGQLSLEECQSALQPDVGPTPGPFLFAYRLNFDGTSDTRRLAELARRLPLPDATRLPHREIIDLLVGDQERHDGLNEQQVALAQEYFDKEEPVAERLGLMVPDSVPAPMPLQIANDIAGTDLEAFQKVFDGFGVLVQRQIGETDEKWQNASLVELLHFDGTETYKDPEDPAGDDRTRVERVTTEAKSLHPLNPMPVDGRMTLYLDYHGLPLSGAAFDSTTPDEEPIHDDVKIAFSAFTAMEDVDVERAGDERVPPLAYGSTFRAAAFGVTKAGSLPNTLHDTMDSKPWLPKLPAIEPPHPLEIAYQRRTAIGRVSMENVFIEDVFTKKTTQSDVAEALKGVQPLSNDYPRLALASLQEDVGRLDLYRNTDGRGALMAALQGEALTGDRKVTLREIQGWGGKARLSIAFYALKWDAKMDLAVEAQLHSPIALDIIPGEAFQDLTISIKQDGAMSVEYRCQTEPGSIVPKELARPHWLRLMVERGGDADTAVSLADTTRDSGQTGKAEDSLDMDFYARPEAVESTIVALKNVRENPDWKAGVPGVYHQKISFPRMTYADFDRWVANKALRSGLWGLDDDAPVDGLIEELLSAYIYRHTRFVGDPDQAQIKDNIDRLPDPAVSHLVVDLVPQDVIKKVPLTPVRLILQVNLDIQQDDLPTVPTVDDADKLYVKQYAALLEKIDRAFVRDLTVRASTGPDLSLKPDDDGNVIVSLPEGVSARLIIRPAVPTRYFKDATTAAVFHPGIAGHARDQNGEDFFVFAGAEAVFEVMTADIEDYTKDLRRLAPDVVTCVLGKRERAYGLRITEPGSDDDRRVWRQLGKVRMLTQRWRFSGRPIYNWPSPADPDSGEAKENPVVELTRKKMSDPAKAFLQFEKEAFFDRDNSDAESVSVQLEPISMTGNPASGQELLRVDWSAPTATMFRHRLEMLSRYSGAMNGRGVVTSWTDRRSGPETDKDTIEAWVKRVIMLADSSRILLNRPQIRAFLPLTQAPAVESRNGSEIGPISPPVLAIVEDRPFAQGGLADRVVGEIRTGIHFGFENRDDPVEPIDLRKEFGPDPRVEMLPTEDEVSQRLSLDQEGPVGLTFDSRNITAPAYPNSQHIFRPTTLDANGLEPGYWQEHAMGLSLRRLLDPGWVVVDGPEIAAMDSLDLNKAWQISSKESGELKVSVFVVKDDGSQEVVEKAIMTLKSVGQDTREAEILNTAIYGTGQTEVPKRLCVVPPGRCSVMHQPLGDGSYQLTVLFVPKVLNFEHRIERGIDNAPRVLASVNWTVEGELASRTLKVDSANSVTPVSASLPTETEWVMQARDAAAVYFADADGLPGDEPVNIAHLAATIKTSGDSWSLSFHDKRDSADVHRWLQPNLGELHRPKALHRRLAVLNTSWSKGLGRRFEVYRSTALLRGKSTSGSKDLPERVRILEFETPVLPVCLNAHEFKGIPENYCSLYLDLVSTGGEEATHYQILIRPIRDLIDETMIDTLKFSLLNPKGNPEKIELKLRESGDDSRAVYVEVNLQISAGEVQISATKINRHGAINALDIVTGPRLNPRRNPGIRLTDFSTGTASKEIWADVSILHGSAVDKGFNFDWVFGSRSGNEDAGYGTKPDTLRGLHEAQARIISISPPIPIDLNEDLDD